MENNLTKPTLALEDMKRKNIKIKRKKVKKAKLLTQQEKELRKVLSFVYIVCAILFLTLLAVMSADNVEAEMSSFDITYENYLLEQGDTLSEIAAENIGNFPGTFEEYISRIATINEIENPNEIKAGENIIIPCYATQEK